MVVMTARTRLEGADRGRCGGTAVRWRQGVLSDIGEGRGWAPAPWRSPEGHPRACQRTTCHPGGQAHAHSPLPTGVQLGNTTRTTGQRGPAWVRTVLALE